MAVDLSKVSSLGGVDIPQARTPIEKTKGGPSFADTLKGLDGGPQKALGSQAGAQEVKFSNHAVDRMMSRGIRYSPDDLNRLNEAINKAAAKGSKDTLVLMNDSALIVSVKNKTVVTVMDRAALKENVFTNIDSTVVI